MMPVKQHLKHQFGIMPLAAAPGLELFEHALNRQGCQYICLAGMADKVEHRLNLVTEDKDKVRNIWDRNLLTLSTLAPTQWSKPLGLHTKGRQQSRGGKCSKTTWSP